MSRRRKYAIEILACLLLAVWLAFYGPVVSRVLGDSPVNTVNSNTSVRSGAALKADRHEKRAVFDRKLKQTATAYANAKISAFNVGLMWTSKGFLLPLDYRAQAAVWCGFHPGSCSTKWWSAPLTAAMCIPYAQGSHCGSNSLPARQETEFHQKLVAADIIAIKCGGAAIIGFFGLRGGAAWWGAGKGAAVCLWTTLFSFAFNFKMLKRYDHHGLSDVELAHKAMKRSDRALAR